MFSSAVGRWSVKGRSMVLEKLLPRGGVNTAESQAGNRSKRLLRNGKKNWISKVGTWGDNMAF